MVDGLRWLEANGFTRTRAVGGEHESFGNLAVTYQRADTIVLIVRDRGQWSCDLRFADVDMPFDLGLVVAVRRGDTSWTYRPHVDGEPMAVLLTGDIDWAEELEAGLAWVEECATAPAALIAENDRRRALVRDGMSRRR